MQLDCLSNSLFRLAIKIVTPYYCQFAKGGGGGGSNAKFPTTQEGRERIVATKSS